MPWALPLLLPPVLQCLCWDVPLVPAQAQGALQGMPEAPCSWGQFVPWLPLLLAAPRSPGVVGRCVGAGSACCSPGQPCLRWSIFTSRASRCTARCGFITLTRETAPCCEHSPTKGGALQRAWCRAAGCFGGSPPMLTAAGAVSRWLPGSPQWGRAPCRQRECLLCCWLRPGPHVAGTAWREGSGGAIKIDRCDTRYGWLWL